MPIFKKGEDDDAAREIKWEDIPPEARVLLATELAEKVAEQLMRLALHTTATVAAGVPPALISAVLQGAHAGLARAEGFLEGDIIASGKLQPDTKGPNGKTVEETLAEDRERFTLQGRADRNQIHDLAQKAAVAAATEPKIGFKMPGAAKPSGGTLN